MQLLRVKVQFTIIMYFLLCNKKKPVWLCRRIKKSEMSHLTQITIKVQLFWRLPYEMYNSTQKWTVYELSAIQKKAVE